MLRRAEEQRRQLFEAGGVVFQKEGKWTGFCPFHHDENKPSFSVFEHQGTGRVQWKCFSGCGEGDIFDFWGKFRNLDAHSEFTEILEDLDGYLGGKVEIAKPPPRQVETEKKQAKLGELVKTYDYMNAEGLLVFQECRYEPKDFRLRALDGNGGWTWSLKGVERVPYRLPDVIGSEIVILVEGAKDADTLAERGLCATAIAGGASSWRKEYAKWFQGKQVVISGDRDLAGDQFVREAAPDIYEVARGVKVIEIPLPWAEKHGPDVTDWLAGGATVRDFGALVGSTPPYRPPVPATPEEASPEDREEPKDSLWEQIRAIASAGGDRDAKLRALIRTARKAMELAGGEVDEGIYAERALDRDERLKDRKEGMRFGQHITVGTPTGIPVLDALLYGIRPVWICVEGYSGFGKSTLVSMFAQCALEEGSPVLFVPLEEPPESIDRMFLARMSQMDGRRISTGEYTCEEEYDRVLKVRDKFLGLRPGIYYPSRGACQPTVAQVFRLIESFQSQVGEGNGQVYIDPVHGVNRGPDQKTDYDKESAAISMIRRVIEEFNIPVISNVHMNKSGAVKGHTGFQHSADVRLFLTEKDPTKKLNEGRPDEDRLYRPVVDLLVLKNKGLPTGALRLLYDKRTSTFTLHRPDVGTSWEEKRRDLR
uniref:Putative helicase n=1 Tax=viral metagenome TaxID=1070528 RepID=A0A6M3X7S0_9ZZZZ